MTRVPFLLMATLIAAACSPAQPPKEEPKDGGYRCGPGRALCSPELCVRPGETTICTTRCETSDTCMPGWTCEDLPDGGPRACNCTPTAKSDICDGKDNDCDGVVDGLPAQVLCQADAGFRMACTGTGGCGCLGTNCDGQCVDLRIDPFNCGACGVVCPGERDEAVCVQGGCTMVDVIQPGAVTGLFGIAADESNVYWTDGQKVCRTNIETKEVTYVDDSSFREIRVAGDELFWNSTAVHGMLLDGGPVVDYSTSSNTFAVSDTDVFWTQSSKSGEDLFSQPRGGGTTQLLASGLQPMFSLIADDTQVYGLSADGALFSVPVNGGAITTLVGNAHPGYACRLAQDATNLYWTAFGMFPPVWYALPQASHSAVLSVPKAGGAVVTLVDSAPALTLYAEVLVDDSSIWWNELNPAGGSAFWRLPKTGGPPEAYLGAHGFLLSDFTLDPGGIDFLSYQSYTDGVYRVPFER